MERRLDNVVYRLGLATTRRQARQFVNHGHILVDGKRVDIPSYRVEVGQVISVREKSAKVPAILEAVEATIGRPAFVSFDAEKLEGSLTRLPERDEINPEINEALVVEFLQQNALILKFILQKARCYGLFVYLKSLILSLFSYLFSYKVCFLIKSP